VWCRTVWRAALVVPLLVVPVLPVVVVGAVVGVVPDALPIPGQVAATATPPLPASVATVATAAIVLRLILILRSLLWVGR
jgi:hypothetical protein